jgi:polysaccharide deacetylase 2 family uncharacterized protein YibQ
MYYQARHVAARLHKHEVMIRAMMPSVSANDPEPLTIYENNRTQRAVKTLTYTASDVVRGAMLDMMDRMGASNV